jgi:hypothetical protein
MLALSLGRADQVRHRLRSHALGTASDPSQRLLFIPQTLRHSDSARHPRSDPLLALTRNQFLAMGMGARSSR